MHNLIESVRSAHTPESFWNAQLLLLEETARLESLIRKRRCQERSLKQAKLAYTHRHDKTIEQVERYDRLIELAQSSEARFASSRLGLRYLGDALAFRLLDDHEVKVLCANQDSGFVSGKDGLGLEIECAGAIAKTIGTFAILTDLTHCLNIGDIVTRDPAGRVLIIECKKPPRKPARSRGHRDDRTARQFARMEYAAGFLANEQKAVVGGSLDDHPYLSQLHSSQSMIERVETLLDTKIRAYEHLICRVDMSQTCLVDQFIEACDLGGRPFKLINPEPGLLYVASRRDTPPSKWTSLIPNYVTSGNREILFGDLIDRVRGAHPYVRPITLHDISTELLTKILNGDLLFYTIIDWSWVAKEIERQNINLKPVIDSLGPRFEAFGTTATQPPCLVVGPRMILSVQYGLLSLNTAVQNIADMAKAGVKIHTQRFLQDDNGGSNSSNADTLRTAA